MNVIHLRVNMIHLGYYKYFQIFISSKINDILIYSEFEIINLHQCTQNTCGYINLIIYNALGVVCNRLNKRDSNMLLRKEGTLC